MLSDTGEAGALTINGKFNIQSGILYLYSPMTNSGTIAFFNTSYGGNGIYLYNDGTTNYQGALINLPGGVINLNNAYYHGILGNFGHEYFINQGVLTCTNSGTVNVATFDNSAGVVTNWSGDLTLGEFTNAFAGFFYAAAGAPIEFIGGTPNAPITPGNALSLNGDGPYQFFGGYLLLTNNLIPDLQLSWGVLELGPDFQGGTITNLTFDSMWLTNETLPITGTMTVNGSTAQVFGNFTVASGGLLNANSGTFHGMITVATNGTMTSGETTIANDASLTVDGTLNVVGYTQLNGPLTNVNAINLTAPINIYNNQANYGGLVNQSGGVINVLTNGPVVSSGGNQEYLVNNGRIIKSGNTNTASINVPGFTNSGSITAQQGMLQLNHIMLLPSGSLNVCLNSKSDYGKIGISGVAALTGVFSATLANNYVPNPGDSFQPLTYGSFTGNLIATNLPPSVTWQTTFNSTALTLLVTQNPKFITFASSNGQMVFSGMNGMPGNTYWILTGTNMAQPLASWRPVDTNQFDSNGDFSFTNALDYTKPEQFFILELQ
jgi:hypothetical protein